MGSLIPRTNGVTKVTVGDVSAKFTIGDRREYIAVKSLGGERSIIANIIDSVNEGDVYYDVGGNKGIYSCFVGQLIDSGDVIVFEPSNDTLETLRKNLNMNDVSGSIHQVGLWDSNEQKQLGCDIRSSGNRVSGKDTSIGISENVSLVRGVDYILENDIPKPDVMKIDIEGAEVRALKGMKKLLPEVRLVYCEVHGWSGEHDLPSPRDYGDRPEGVVSILEETGFEIQEMSPNDGNNQLVSRYGEKFIKAINHKHE